ncbi:MAG TPA: nuclear transport factor 2 family protein [Myxococcota bacterium]|nr:nuclear transport factor 2 family protein [Myxococcota bacterium]
MGDPVDRETRQDVAELLVRYATGIDRRDWKLFRSCFSEDFHGDYGESGGLFESVEAIAEFMIRAHASMGHILHRITNVAVTRSAEGRVAARSYVDAVLMSADNQRGVHAIGFYDDELVRGDDGWRIARRRFTTVRIEPIGGR